MPLTVKQLPYTGPYSNAETNFPHQGPTVEALKRAVSRLGLLKWKGLEFTATWPRPGDFDRAFRRWQASHDMPADGIYGEQEWKALRAERVDDGEHAGEYALDAYARKLIREEYAAENVPDEADARAAITKFCLIAESREPYWHYRQARPVDVSVDPRAPYIWSDCSGYVIQAYHAARVACPGLDVPDPAIQGWTGYGNTSEHEDDHVRVSEPYKVGDLAHYVGHVTICRKGGTETTAIFSSHGQEAGPMPTSLHYRSDLRFVVRPPLRGVARDAVEQ